MDKNKHIKIEVFNSRNIYADVFIPMMRRPGFNTGVKTTYSIICFRQVGVSLGEKEELEKLSLMLKKFQSHNILYLLLHGKLDFNPQNSTIQLVKEKFANYESNANLIRAIVNNIFLDKSIIRLSLEESKISILKDAIVSVLSDFESSEPNVNSSKMINITVKLIYWVNKYLGELLDKTNLSLDKTEINPKIIHFADLTHQDSYMLLLSYYLGFDSLHIDFEDSNESNFSSKLLEYSTLAKYSLNVKNDLLINFVKKQNNQDNVEVKKEVKKIMVSPQQDQYKSIKNEVKKETNIPINTSTRPPITRSNINISTSNSKLIKKDIDSSIILSHKKFDGDIKSILAPLKDRAGYSGMPSPVLPIYFTRYIGVDSDKAVYRNRIFNFDHTLSHEYKNYMRLASPVQIGDYSHITKKTNAIWKEFQSISLDKLDDLIKYLNGSNVLDFIHDNDFKNRCYIALREVLKFAFHGSNSIPTSKVKNLVIKLIGWLSDHNSKLISGYSFDKTNNPKVLFYGDIKSHEALYLIFLYYAGVDIIYINSFQDDVFEALDPDSNISCVYTLDKVHLQEDFPTSEVMVLKQTTAYEASEEIAKIVHNDQDGVYKPWQFEKYKVMPLTLKTTYDEVIILWNEDARIRTGFKVEKNTIYIPNMFVKISATQDDISEYWRLVHKLSSSKLTQFYDKLPFTNTDFSIRELSLVDTVFENHSSLSYEKLRAHSLYKYSHLSDELQSLIFDKICILLDNDILNKNISELRLKIVLTVLKLNSDLLKLIQSFDFPAQIPKLVICDFDEITFSESDSITMAFLYALGFDICVLTPTGYNNFEMFIDEKYYNIFKLPNKQFNLELPDLKKYSSTKSKGFWSSIFG